jgi:hypothetical protein
VTLEELEAALKKAAAARRPATPMR